MGYHHLSRRVLVPAIALVLTLALSCAPEGDVEPLSPAGIDAGGVELAKADRACGCPEIFTPTCGSDGVYYYNECEAECNGTTFACYGRCPCTGGGGGGGGSCHWGPNGDYEYCSPSCPCDAGEGDCDSNAECARGLECAQDVGRNYGFASDVDVCESRSSCQRGRNGDYDYCSPSCPCDAGEGDCDSNGECAPGLECAQDVGRNYGFASDVDVCESRSSCHRGRNGDYDYCSPSCPCDAGEGDCDSNAECAAGLECAQDVGRSYGFASDVDVCESRSSCHWGANGDYDYCSWGCPCDAGEGDCDSNGECAPGLECLQNVGADYGFAADVDVCDRESGTECSCPDVFSPVCGTNGNTYSNDCEANCHSGGFACWGTCPC